MDFERFVTDEHDDNTNTFVDFHFSTRASCQCLQSRCGSRAFQNQDKPRYAISFRKHIVNLTGLNRRYLGIVNNKIHICNILDCPKLQYGLKPDLLQPLETYRPVHSSFFEYHC